MKAIEELLSEDRPDGAGDDDLTGGTGADSFVYKSTGDGDDVFIDFGVGADTVDLDALFDALGAGFNSADPVANPAARAAAVNVDNTSDQGVGDMALVDTVLTVDTAAGVLITGFSITFQDVTLSDPAGADFTVADLAALGIDVFIP